jgi:serine/threonine protein kinase
VNLMGSNADVQSQINDVTNEMDLLSRLHHDNLVTYYGVVCDREMMQVRLFMELVTGGSLAGLVQEMAEPLPEQTAQKFVRQIVRGLAYIHEHGIVHRDLKCDNIMQDAASGQVKLADFGTAKCVGNAAGASRAAQTMIGTPYFMAPEILAAMTAEEAEAGYGVKADIWSLGITVAELLDRGNPPWPAFASPAHAFLHIANPETRPIVPAHISGHAADFIAACTVRDPRRRPSAIELLQHAWLLEIPDAVPTRAFSCGMSSGDASPIAAPFP